MEKHKKKTRLRWDRIIIAIVVLLIIVAGVFYLVKKPFKSSNVAKNGDIVYVDYIGTLENGTIFDTSIQEEAVKANLFSEQKQYQPLQFNIGQNQLIPGFENAVIGMKVNEEKTIKLNPKDAYGEYDETRILTLPRTQELNRTIIINKTFELSTEQFIQFFQKEPTQDEIFTVQQFPWQLKIISTSNNIIKIEHQISKGETVIIPGTAWNSTIDDIKNNEVQIKQNPVDGQEIETPIGVDKVKVESKVIKIISTPRIGETIQTVFGNAKVLSMNETTFILDLNSPLAGKTLIFKIILRDIQKA